MIVGDFNLPDINWNTLQGTTPSSKSFCDFVFEHNLSQLVHEPTHIHGNILDLILTNCSDYISDVSIFNHNIRLFSDHSIISFSLSLSAPSTAWETSHFVFDFPKANLEGLFDFLFIYDFTPCLLSDDVETVWSLIKLAIYDAMNLFIPKVQICCYQYPRWFTPELRHLSK